MTTVCLLSNLFIENYKKNQSFIVVKYDTYRAASTLRCEDVLRLTSSFESVVHLKELARMLHCAAYNVLIAVISSTQSEIKFYNGFIFPADNLAKVWQLFHCCVLNYFILKSLQWLPITVINNSIFSMEPHKFKIDFDVGK